MYNKYYVDFFEEIYFQLISAYRKISVLRCWEEQKYNKVEQG